MSEQTEITLYSSPEHACGYLEDRVARNLIIDPALRLDPALYQQLLARGFRRSGAHVYRPCCSSCDACVPLRIPTRRFRPNRSQRRVLQRNQDIRIDTTPPRHCPEQYALYRKYTAHRHAGSEMASAEPEHYVEFLTAPWAQTQFLELRDDQSLIGVAVTDVMPNALSAVYTFFDPALAKRSPGVLSVLVQIQLAQRLQLDWLYLGYWIAECQKMSYKTVFRPHELYVDGSWRLST